MASSDYDGERRMRSNEPFREVLFDGEWSSIVHAVSSVSPKITPFPVSVPGKSPLPHVDMVAAPEVHGDHIMRGMPASAMSENFAGVFADLALGAHETSEQLHWPFSEGHSQEPDSSFRHFKSGGPSVWEACLQLSRAKSSDSDCEQPRPGGIPLSIIVDALESEGCVVTSSPMNVSEVMIQVP